MAGVGPAPKFNRARDKKPARGDWVTLEPLESPVIPELNDLPLPGDCEEWPYTARRYWDSWRDSPVTSRWADDDIALAIDTISQFAATSILRKGSGGVPLAASEMRLRMESLGLTPEGRRKNRILLPEEDTPDEAEVTDINTKKRGVPEAV